MTNDQFFIMQSEIIIDAYNLIHRVSDLRRFLNQSLEEAREQLLRKLVLFRKDKKIKITCVFDGNNVSQPSNETRWGIQIHFSVPPRKADEVIKILIQRKRNPQNVTVISSDNEILGFARNSRAQIMTSEEFYRKYLMFEIKFDSPVDTQPTMSEAELQQWLDLFNEGSDSKSP
jgi:predicted RNA-binding protein with PIN domain